MIRPSRSAMAHVALLLLLLQAAPGAETGAFPKITAEEARLLVGDALLHLYPHHDIEVSLVNNKYDPDFFYFEANWYGPIRTSPHLGNFAVNPWTGDVFNADNCKRLTSPSLKKAQGAIRKRLGLGREDYARLRAKRPVCSIG